MKMADVEHNRIEYKRIKKLSEFDLDYGNLHEEFKGLVELAAHVAGTEISLINLIDQHSQWSVSRHNLDVFQMDLEYSICQHTIQSDHIMEIPHLGRDERFSDRPFVKADDGFRYYLGIPLKVKTGENIGALCVMDYQEKSVSEEKKKLLRLIANEIVEKLENKLNRDELQEALDKATVQRNQLAHDVRGPIGGILGLATSTENVPLDEEEFMQYMQMIKASAAKLLELTDDILERQKAQQQENYFNLSGFKRHLEGLYELPARNKEIRLDIVINQKEDHQKFPRRKLLPIVGNLIANAIKFTPSQGTIGVDLDISGKDGKRALMITVSDNGKGIPKERLENIKKLAWFEDHGTDYEKGYGLGLQLVTEMVEDIHGTLHIDSEEGKGTSVRIVIPLKG
ncbi:MULTISPECIES: GAF domain-containing sensor histidine kinase [unclassified Allomuricauda]|uniref:GAF domain-containing sensor histidine kinase n=1 Tax=unclassified Allomuricauda TaxID=2615049 RepID=UPI00273F0032|nr:MULTISPECIES: GAF domain-containing sensor histidine kinase [unclassified Allomuricauda]